MRSLKYAGSCSLLALLLSLAGCPVATVGGGPRDAGGTLPDGGTPDGGETPADGGTQDGGTDAGNGTSLDWPTYLHDNLRTSTAPLETKLSPSTAPNLKLLWTFRTGGTIEASPIIVGNVLYVGSWDGYEYAVDAIDGGQIWKSPFLGQTNVGTCNGYPANQGISSTATLVGDTLYLGGGGPLAGQTDTFWYALNASTGAILWSVDTGNAATDGYYNWSSPLVSDGYAYVNIASAGNCPSVAGAVLQLRLADHAVTNTWNAVESGELGGALWSSPVLDAATNTLYVTTGSPVSGTQATQPYTVAIVALDATTLSLKGSWQISPGEASSDSDFGAGATLFDDPSGRALVGAANKDGYFYALDRSTLTEVWESQLDTGGDNPLSSGSISPAAIANGVLYVGAGDGSLHAIQTDGRVLWSVTTAGYVLGAAVYANGVVVDGAGDTLEVRDAADGGILYTYETNPSAEYNLLETSPVIWNGRIYVGSADGNLYVFGF